MKIGEIATEAGVTVDTVRFYERVGVLPPPARTESGYRDYERDTIERIKLSASFSDRLHAHRRRRRARRP